MLRPGKRRQIEALARLRPLAILDGTIQGEKGQPSDSDLRRLGNAVTDGNSWDNIFKGVAAIDFTARGTGPDLSLRLSKKEGIPIQLVPEGTPGAAVVAVKRVDELAFYSFGAKQLAEKLGLTMPKALAGVDHSACATTRITTRSSRSGRARTRDTPRKQSRRSGVFSKKSAWKTSGRNGLERRLDDERPWCHGIRRRAGRPRLA